MIAVRQFLLTVAVAGILCAVVTAVGPRRGVNGQLIKMLCGVFLLLTVTGQLGNTSLSDLGIKVSGFSSDAQAVSAKGETAAKEAIAEGIKQAAEAYILDKARMYDADLKVEVKVLWSDTPELAEVKLTGAYTPYAKQLLSRLISTDLGVPEEAQNWSG